LITGVEIIPTQTTPALHLGGDGASEPQLLALQSLAEAIIATDKDGRITFLNPAAEHLTGSGAAGALGKLLEDIVSLVDETDRRLLSDPVHQALTNWRTRQSQPARPAAVAHQRQRALHRAVGFAHPQQRPGAHRRGGAVA